MSTEGRLFIVPAFPAIQLRDPDLSDNSSTKKLFDEEILIKRVKELKEKRRATSRYRRTFSNFRSLFP